MTTEVAAKMLHYELLKRTGDYQMALACATFMTDMFLETLVDLEADNIKAEEQQYYDGYGNLMGYLTSMKDKLIEL